MSLLLVLAPEWKSWDPDRVGTRESQGRGTPAELQREGSASLLKWRQEKARVLGIQSLADCVTLSKSLNLSE